MSENEVVVEFSKRSLGNRVDRGECYDLADKALENAGAKSAPDYGKVTADGDYIWGSQVKLSEVKPGDIIQFRNYEVKVTESDGAWRSQSRPHHTAVVGSVGKNGDIMVYEQNVGPQSQSSTRKVQYNQLYFSSGQVGTKNVSVNGSVWFYRPQPKSP